MREVLCERCDEPIRIGDTFYHDLDGWDILCESCKDEIVEDARWTREESDEEVFGYYEG